MDVSDFGKIMNDFEKTSGFGFGETDACGLDSEEGLIIKYSQLVRACARPYFLAGGDSEDLIQEGMMGLLSAIRHYDPDREVQFKTYAEYCIKRRLLDAIKTASRFKHTPLNDYISFESPQFDENVAPSAYCLRDPEELVIAREHVDEITNQIYGSLSRFEKKILDLYLEGMSYAEMSAQVKKSSKSVDNAVQRIRRKLSQQISSGDISRS